MRCLGIVRRLAFAVLVCMLSLLISGCGGPRALVLSEWMLQDGTTVVVPEHLDEHALVAGSGYVLRKRVAIPIEMRGRPLTLAFPQLRTLCSVLVDGRLMTPLDFEEGYRGSHHPRFRIPADAVQGEAVDLELRLERSWTQSAWLDAPPRLSATTGGDEWSRFVRAFNTWTAIAALMSAGAVFLSYVIIFALDRRKSAHGWFALEALTCLSYPAFQLGLTTPLFGTKDAAVMATSLCVAIVSSVHFSHAVFGLPRPRRAFDAPVLVCALAALAYPGPFVMTKFVAPVTVVTVTGNVVYQLVMTGREWRRTDRPVHALVLFASWAALGVFGSVDFLAWLGAGEIFAGLRGACLGIVCIATLQSVLLSRDLIEALRESDSLNTELAGRVRALEEKNAEVSVLNAELRRQISARSEQMAMLLAHSGPSAHFKASALVPGSVVDGRYRIERSVGAGGMGAVYEVTRLADGRRLALKVLTEARDGSAVARFAREAQIVAEIAHPNVVAIVDVELTATGMAYLVMEFVEGLSLRQHTNQYGNVEWALTVLGQIAEGLAVVHAHGVVHRDLKPANVLITTAKGATLVKIADFGVSSAPLSAVDASKPATPAPSHGAGPSSGTQSPGTGALRVPGLRSLPEAPEQRNDAANATTLGHVLSSVTTALERQTEPDADSTSSSPHPTPGSGRGGSNLTRTGILMGTPKYMAPELAVGAKEARPSSDVFSFGVIAYELLTGKAPFAESPAERRLRGSSFPPPPPLRERCPTLSPRIADMLDRCLAKAPELRPTARELADLLARPAAPISERTAVR